MRKTRILLSVDEQLPAQLLKQAFASCDYLELIGEVTDVIDTLVCIRNAKPDLWVHSLAQGDELEALLSHAYSCHPSLIAVRVVPSETSGFAQIRIDSIANLLKFASRSQQLVA